MSQTGPKNYLGTRNDIAIEEEWVIPLPAIVSVSGSTITFAANSLSNPGITVNMLSGQEIWVLDDFAHSTVWKGVVLHVVSNTTNTITVEEVVEGTNIWTEFSGLGTDLGDVTDRLVVTQRGIRPGAVDITMYDYLGALGATGSGDFTRHDVSTMFGVIDQADLPDPVHDLEEKYAHGSSNMPRRHRAVYNRTSYGTSWPLSTVWGKYFFSVFGQTVDEASAFDTATDAITADVYPGEYVVEVADSSDFTVNDYIELGNHNDVPLAGTDSEIRKIVNLPAAGYIVVDKPFRRLHAVAAGMAISEVDSTCYNMNYESANYIQHALSVAPALCYNTLAVTKKGIFDDITVNDWKMLYLGHVFNEVTFSTATNKELTSDMSSTGMNAKLDETGYTPATLSRTYLVDSSGNALEPIHFSRGYVTISGVRWHQCEDFEIGLSRTIDPKWAHAYFEKSAGTVADGLEGGRKAQRIPVGRASITHNFIMPLHNKQLWTLLNQRTNFTTTAVFEMLRSTTFTETWTFTMTNMAPTEGGTQLPNEPTESQNVAGPPENLGLTIKDKTPYY